MSENDGKVFTRPWVAEMMLDLCEYKESADLSSLRLLEPSAGDGSFLTEIVRRLCISTEQYSISNKLLYNSISAFDIDENNVKLCRENISSILKEFGWEDDEKKEAVNRWIRLDDFLLQDLNDFDIVVGNPPYIRSSDIPREKREMYTQVCKTMTMGTDLFVGFIEKGLRAINKDGKLCFICADRWMQNAYGGKLRNFILENHHMDAIIRMHGVDAFEKKVSAYPAIILINGDKKDTVFVDCEDTFNKNNVSELLNCIKNNNAEDGGKAFAVSIIPNFECGTRPWPLTEPKLLEFIKYSSERFPQIEDCGIKIGIGIATGSDETFISTQPKIVEEERMLPLLKSEDIIRSAPPVNPKHWLINPWNSDGTLVDLSEYPVLNSYFQSKRDDLLNRHIAKKNTSQWYRTIDKIKNGLIETPKLLVSDLSHSSDPVLESGSFYPHHNMYWLTSDRWDLEVLGGLLMSKHVESIVEAYGVKMRGKTKRFQAQYLRLIHLPELTEIGNSVCSDLRQAFRNRDVGLATAAANDAFDLTKRRSLF